MKVQTLFRKWRCAGAFERVEGSRRVLLVFCEAVDGGETRTQLVERWGTIEPRRSLLVAFNMQAPPMKNRANWGFFQPDGFSCLRFHERGVFLGGEEVDPLPFFFLPFLRFVSRWMAAVFYRLLLGRCPPDPGDET